MDTVVFRLALSREELLRYYRGGAYSVHVRALDGRTVQFPASALRDFVNHDGIHGLFQLYYETGGKLSRLERLE